MFRKLCISVLLALAAQVALAQQAPAQPAEPALHERIGGAVKGFFESIFGSRPAREGEIPQAPVPAQPGEGQAVPAPAPAREPAAATPAQPVETTPSAVATQSLPAAIAKGEYAVAVKLIEHIFV